MKLKNIICYLVIFVMILSMPVVQGKNDFTKECDIIYVNCENINGPWDGSILHPYKTINEALDVADDNMTIQIFNGIYLEEIKIDKKITLVGDYEVIIDGNYSNYVVQLLKNNITLKNLTIRNSGGYVGNAGIMIDSSYNKIINCKIYRTINAIIMNNSNYNEIYNCRIYQNGEGLLIQNSKENKIVDSCFSHNAYGIKAQYSKDIQIINSYAHTNGLGIVFNDSSYINVTKSAIFNNNDNGGGLVIYGCEIVDIYNCNINHNGFGISIGNSSEVIFNKCSIKWNDKNGFRVWEKGKEIKVLNSEISNNFRTAVNINDAECVFNNNNIFGNLLGMVIFYSNCDLRNNWWGSFLGPSYFDWFTNRDRVIPEHSSTRVIPWLKEKNNNFGSDWEVDFDRFSKLINISRFKQITFEEDDSDNDLVPDWWEEKWGYNKSVWDDHANLDPDNDALNNIEECYTDKWDSNPFIKDIFIEVDWFESSVGEIDSNKPTEKYINKLENVFSDHEINIHIDNGCMGGGEQLEDISEFYYWELRDIYWDNFLHNDLNNPRKGIFHYCFVTDYGPYPGFGGFAFFGWDHLDSWEIAGQRVDENHPLKNKQHVILSIIMHELGHNMGLLSDDCGGNDNLPATKTFSRQWFKYFPYQSIMNYMFTYWILDYSDGSRGKNDYDDWSNLEFDFFKDSHFEWPKD